MYVRFKKNIEPCIQYKVLDEKGMRRYDKVLKRFAHCIYVQVIGWVAEELVCEATHPDNNDSIDVAIKLSQK